ncbi:MAG: hypothetical protein HY401_09095 [Elusimicrobia bacterium]|nr:hypothetical protein [Elusimicrobiota bacterium]
MNRIQAYQALRQSGKLIFTLSDLRKLLDIASDNTAYKQTGRLVEAGILTRCAKAIYSLGDAPPSDFALANILQRPSYLSLESALNYYGLLLQTPREITSVTARRAKTIRRKGKIFVYRHLEPSLFGASFIKENNFLIASPEQAFVETIFFASLGKLALDWRELKMKMLNKREIIRRAGPIRHPAFHKLLDNALR